MALITFEQLHAEVRAFHAAEVARNTPAAVARRAVYTLASALTDLGTDERRAVRELLADELAELDAPIIA